MAKILECKSWDGVTIGLIDALLSISRALTERVEAETERLKKTDDQWLSNEVQEALSDLRHDDVLKALIYPQDIEAARIIREAAVLIKTRDASNGK